MPAGGDAYVLKHIIHNWDDEKSLQILRNVRGAMNPDEKMFIAEAVAVSPIGVTRRYAVGRDDPRRI